MTKIPEFLQVLLTADPNSEAFLQAAARLESQPEWQPVLEKMAVGETPWWESARVLLQDSQLDEPPVPRTTSVLVAIDSTLADEAADPDSPAAELERVPLAFLDPPAHPELLGRFERYDVERLLGTGGMGVVLRAFDSELHRVVAIKVLAQHLAHSSSARRRFSREARAAAAVVHPNVIPIYNVGTEANVPYLVMQYVAGHSLQRRVDESGPLPVEDVLRIAAQTAAGLAAAHQQGVVHRDVKPANILLEEDVDRVLLSDFGLARTVDDASLTRTGIVAGTPDYMSPEQAQGEPLDPRSDLFSLGSVLYFMLTGRPPFRASGAMAVLHRICNSEPHSVRDINCSVPVELAQLIGRCLEKRPENRMQSAAELESELTGLLNRLQRGELRLSSASTEDQAARPRVTAVTLTVALLGLIAAGLGWWVRQTSEVPPMSNLDTSAESVLRGAGDGVLPPTAGKLPKTVEVDRFYDEAVRLQTEIRLFQAAEPSYRYEDPFSDRVHTLQRAIEHLQVED